MICSTSGTTISLMVSFISKSSVVRFKRKVRAWEQKNLPIYGSEAGYALFLELASLKDAEQITLKQLYLSMKHSESTTRLLLRNLEEDGWLELTRSGTDGRYKCFKRTPKLDAKITEWTEYIQSCILSTSSPK